MTLEELSMPPKMRISVIQRDYLLQQLGQLAPEAISASVESIDYEGGRANVLYSSEKREQQRINLGLNPP